MGDGRDTDQRENIHVHGLLGSSSLVVCIDMFINHFTIVIQLIEHAVRNGRELASAGAAGASLGVNGRDIA